MIAGPHRGMWIAVSLVDQNEHPVPNELYSVTFPDGHSVTGRLDRRGRVRIEGATSGECKISFPERQVESA